MSSIVELLLVIVTASRLFLGLVYATRRQGPGSRADSYRPNPQAWSTPATTPGRAPRGQNRHGSRGR